MANERIFKAFGTGFTSSLEPQISIFYGGSWMLDPRPQFSSEVGLKEGMWKLVKVTDEEPGFWLTRIDRTILILRAKPNFDNGFDGWGYVIQSLCYDGFSEVTGVELKQQEVVKYRLERA